MKPPKIARAYGLAAFCFTVAAVFATLGGVQVWNIRSLRLRGETVSGQVVAADIPDCIRTRGGGCTSKHHTWIEVEYVTLSGQKIRHRTTGAVRDSAAVGSWIELRYDREQPQHVQDAYAPLDYTHPLAVSGSFTAAFLLFTALLLRKRRRAD